jgi:hypothetical protein
MHQFIPIEQHHHSTVVLEQSARKRAMRSFLSFLFGVVLVWSPTLGQPSLVTDEFVASKDDSSMVAQSVESVKASLAIALPERMVADRETYVAGKVTVVDVSGATVRRSGIVTLKSDSGAIRTIDIDPDQDGLQLFVYEGVADFEFGGLEAAGITSVTATFDETSATTEIVVVPAPEPFSLVGSLSGTGMSSTANVRLDGLRSDHTFDDGLMKEGRVAIFGRGNITPDYHLTLSFDSDRHDRSRLFKEVDPDFLYSIYGDNSMLYYDVQSSRNLFVKLERDRSYLFIGDFNTGLTEQEFSLYSRSFSGAKINLENDDVRATAFGTLTNRQVVQREIRGEGLSGFYPLGFTNIVPGSDKIRIETRDRFRSEIVLERTERQRYLEYEIDYLSGTVYFKQPIPAIDPLGNPVYIVATFEVTTNNASTYIAGGRVEGQLLESFRIGLTGVTEEQDPKNYLMLSGDVRLQLGSAFTLGGEVARSSTIGGDGVAYKVESSVSPITELSLRGYYRRVESGFANTTQSGSQRELGTTKYGVGGSVQPTAGTSLRSEYYESMYSTGLASVTVKSLSGFLEQRIVTDLTGSVGLEDLRYSGPGPDTSKPFLAAHSTLATARVTYSASSVLSLSGQYDRNLGSDRDATRPNAASLLGEYKVMEGVTLLGQQRFDEGGGMLSALGIQTTPFDGTSLYGKYELRSAAEGRRNAMSVGLFNRIPLPYDLTATLGFERTRSVERRLNETPVNDHAAYSAGLEYLPDAPIKAFGKAEYGTGAMSRKTNVDVGGAFQFARDLSLLAKYRYNKEEQKSAPKYFVREHVIAGIAFRPVEWNAFNLLAKGEMRSDRNHASEPFIDDIAYIGSVHAFAEPVKRVEIGTKLAYKIVEQDAPDLSLTSSMWFGLFRGRVLLSDWLDLGGEYRILHQRETDDLLRGYSAEAGVSLIQNLRVAVGYNFKGYREKDLVDYTLWSKGPFVRLNLKFTEELFGLTER